MSNFASLSDEQLQQMATGGDRRAEDELAERYVRLVRVCARPYFLAGGDSEDLTQEGMLGLLSAIREYNDQSGIPFKAFAEVCIRRRIYSAIKSASRMKHTPLFDSALGLVYCVQLSLMSPEVVSRASLRLIRCTALSTAFSSFPQDWAMAR